MLSSFQLFPLFSHSAAFRVLLTFSIFHLFYLLLFNISIRLSLYIPFSPIMFATFQSCVQCCMLLFLMTIIRCFSFHLFVFVFFLLFLPPPLIEISFFLPPIFTPFPPFYTFLTLYLSSLKLSSLFYCMMPLFCDNFFSPLHSLLTLKLLADFIFIPYVSSLLISFSYLDLFARLLPFLDWQASS